MPNLPPYAFIQNDRLTVQPTAMFPGRNPELYVHQAGPMVPGWKFEDIMPALAARADGYLRARAADKQPFFLSCSILPLLLGQPTNYHPGRLVEIHAGVNGMAVHQGRWKLVESKVKRVNPARPDALSGLYDLQTDPSETNNVITQHPEIATTLKAQLAGGHGTDRWVVAGTPGVADRCGRDGATGGRGVKHRGTEDTERARWRERGGID